MCGEDITNPKASPWSQKLPSDSSWMIPTETGKDMRGKYDRILKEFAAKRVKATPLIGNLKTAYEFYRLPEGKITNRDETMPVFTTFTKHFKATLDHIFYNHELLRLISLLEIPEATNLMNGIAIPSLMFPSDHFRIEA